MMEIIELLLQIILDCSRYKTFDELWKIRCILYIDFFRWRRQNRNLTLVNKRFLMTKYDSYLNDNKIQYASFYKTKTA